MVIPISGFVNNVTPQIVDDRKQRLQTTFTEYGLEHGFDAESSFDSFWQDYAPQEGDTSLNTIARLDAAESDVGSFLESARTSATQANIAGQNAGQTGEGGVVFGMAQDNAGMQGAASTLLTGTTGVEEDPLVRRRRLMAGNTATQDLLGYNG